MGQTISKLVKAVMVLYGVSILAMAFFFVGFCGWIYVMTH